MDNLLFYKMVRSFMEVAGQITPTHIVTPDSMDLRNKLFIEEVTELKQAIDDNDKVGQLDAICDTLYIACGTAVTFVDPVFDGRLSDAFRLSRKSSDTQDRIMLLMGCYNQMQYSMSAIDHIITIAKNLSFSTPQVVDAFKRVHESNMTKFCKSKREADDTMRKYMADSIDCSWIERKGKFVVVREDGKILKSVYYKPVILEDLV